MATQDAKTQPPELKRQALEQKAAVVYPVVNQTERNIRQAFAQAKASVQPTLQAFARAYAAEYERLNVGRSDDEPPVPVPFHWLLVSGWRAKIKAALAQAAHQAGQQSLAYVLHAQDDTAVLGDQHAQRLIVHALHLEADAYTAELKAKQADERQQHSGRGTASKNGE